MTDTKEYTKLLNQLKNKEIDKIDVLPDDFMNFQTAFMDFETRKRIVGTAHQNGKITYVYNYES